MRKRLRAIEQRAKISLEHTQAVAYCRGMININVSLSGTKTYVGRITGSDPTYRYALAFVALTRKSATHHAATITEPGQYKLSTGAVVGTRRIDTGYITVSDDGAVTEIAAPQID